MRKSRFPFYVIFLVLVVVLGGGAITLFRDMTPPEIILSPEEATVSPNLEIQLTLRDSASPIRSVTVNALKAGRILPVLNQTFDSDAQEQTSVFSLKDTGLRDGTVELEIKAKDASSAWFGNGNTATRVITYTLDSTPPRISQKTSQAIVRRGGAGCVLFGASKELRKAGVEVDGLFFPAYKQNNGDYLCFFAFPYYMEVKAFNPTIVAIDIAGNKQSTPVDTYRLQRDFKHDTINISPSFLDSKAAEFEILAPGQMTDIERFLKVNGPIRRSNAESLFEIAKETAPSMVWEGIFLRLPRAAARAGFADNRTYMWENKKVDEQTHLGYDFASTAQAEIPAANFGKVVFSGSLGIYGNLVIIDHGAGVHSLYSHLSQILVQKGQDIKKGDIVGHTGKTGMAGGDHLHYGMLVGGLEVTPLEWLDSKWIKDNVTDRLKAAGLPKQ